MRFSMFFILGSFIAAAAWLIGSPAWAEVPMDTLYCDVRDLTVGNIGTLVGLGMAFMGFFMFIMKGSAMGIFFVIIGIAVTAFPGLLNSFIEGMSTASSEADTLDINDASCSSGTFVSDKPTMTNPFTALQHKDKTPSDCTDGGPC